MSLIHFSQLLNVFLFAQSVLTGNKNTKLVLVIGLLFILTRVIRFCLSAEKESRAASQFGHVLLTLAGLLCAGCHFCTHPNTPQIHHQKLHITVLLD